MKGLAASGSNREGESTDAERRGGAALAADNIEAEVIDLRSLRPLDDQTVMASVTKT